MPAALYDAIGLTYSTQRRPDPRIEAAIVAALGGARSILNVGAGAGSYELRDRHVVALEPSPVMIAQRPPRAAKAVQGRAEALPFADRSFDAVMAILTLHHWVDRDRGLAECARVARQRVVLLTWDAWADAFWLSRDYIPAFAEYDRRTFPRMEEYARLLGPAARVEILPVPVPRDCVDGFLCAYWARPEAYLDPGVQAGISAFALNDCRAGLERLRADLASGAWHARYGLLLEHESQDLGYRLVVAETGLPTAHYSGNVTE